MIWVLLDLIIGVICGLIFVANMSAQPRESSAALAWLMVIVFIPFFGVPLYLVFGGRKIQSIIRKKQYLYSKTPEAPRSEAGITEKILAYHGIPQTTEHNQVELIGSGVLAYDMLMDLIKTAKKCIEIQTYIIGNDEVGDAILQHLAERARDGVKVRLLLDGLYAFMFPKKKLNALKAAGAEVFFFLPVRFRIFRSKLNLRNHRKLVIFDNQVAIMGGMNLAKDYMGPVQDDKRWCDIALKVTGGCVHQINKMFQSDWRFASGETLEAVQLPSEPITHKAPIQIVASGPDVNGDAFYNTLITAAYNAKHSMTVVTPYFVPDVALAKAWGLAALRGVKVTIIIPRHSNHPATDLARSRHIRNLINAGAKVYFFEPTMLHAKVIMIDQDIAIVGSANCDIRSLFYNFEACLYLYGKEEVSEIARWIEALKLKCSDKRVLEHPTKMRMIMENIALLISPLL